LIIANNKLRIINIFCISILITFIIIPTFAQTRPPYEDEPITKDDLIQIQNRLEKLENKENVVFGQFIAVIALAVAFVSVFLSFRRSGQALQETKKSFNHAQTISEANMLMRIEERFQTEKIQKLMSNIALDKDFSEITTGTIYDYLSIFQTIYNLGEKEILSWEIILNYYGNSIEKLQQNSHIKSHIKKERSVEYPHAWIEIDKLAERLSKEK